ncbi:MAG TPA: biotin-dependent carboxyltransferase family protein [Chitinophagaceae bacterium]|nr:biotin-dependent carboxyltransferase family protein [Chitinophagaceae bacterium]
MSVSILRSGVLDTIQDVGRYGYSNYGINISGPMDPYAMKVANLLVSNPVEKAVIEIHFPGPQVLFEQNALISLTGADFAPTINGEPVPMWKPLVVRRKSVLLFSHLEDGARCYLAVHGGFCVPKWLESSSTNLKAKSGGWQGRKLEKGDEINFGETNLYYPVLLKENNVTVLPWSVDRNTVYQLPHEIGFIPGHEWSLLSEESRQRLLQNNFIIHPSSDRMGYNLRGPEINPSEDFQLVSSAVSFGTIQLLPNHQLIILMADHQTTGGYPRLGHVISAHLPKLAQLAASDSLTLIPVDMSTAEQLLFSQEMELQIISNGCADRMKNAICLA